MLDGIFWDGFSWMFFLSFFFGMVCLPPLDGFLDGFFASFGWFFGPNGTTNVPTSFLKIKIDI